MRLPIYTAICIVFCFLACKDAPVAPKSYNPEGYAEMELTCIPPPPMGILAPYEAIEEAFGVQRSDVRIIENGHNDYRVKGFVMWDIKDDYENRGVYISESKNQYADEGDDFVAQMVSGLKGAGERDSEGNVEKYLDWVDIGDDSAYSPVTHTYVWQVKNCLLFKIVFNLPYDDSVISDAAPVIAKQLTDQYLERSAL